MRLSTLLEGVDVVHRSGADLDIREVQFDSRKVRPGDLFVAVVGTRVDGHEFLQEVCTLGAIAIIGERDRTCVSPDVAYIKVKDSSRALGIVANNYYGNPSRNLCLVGVTGTNGKTTTATLAYRMFSLLGYSSGLLSTIRNYAGDSVVPSTHTTGDALQIASLMGRMIASGCTHCFMEVTSHAIHQKRIAGLEFKVGVFTNLSHDHLDYHGTMEAYTKVKKSFFDALRIGAFALSNTDDPLGNLMLQDTPAGRKTYGQNASADFRLEILGSSPYGLKLRVGGEEFNSRFVGTFNAYNLAAAFGIGVLSGLPSNHVAAALSELSPVEGRMEKVNGPDGMTVIVDFAHTPDALAKVLTTIREFSSSDTVISVLGCGGNRDRDKRAPMGEIAARLSDRAIFTTDNPRDEDAGTIVSEMLSNIPYSFRSNVEVILDRREAIREACSVAPAGSIILVAGKGHEKYQEIRGQRLPFDDVEVAREIFASLEAARS